SRLAGDGGLARNMSYRLSSDREFLDFLERIRLFELDQSIDIIQIEKPVPAKMLEIGAGSGWQAKELAKIGYDVSAIDLENSLYVEQRVWDVIDYDGQNIPFPDAHFDVVFSSNVLEHIPHVVEFQNEIRRVLKPDGVAVHLLPSGSWRIWTTLTHYPFCLKFAAKILLSKMRRSGSHEHSGLESPSKEYGRPEGKMILRAMWPHRHGEFGNTLTEIFYFSKFRWMRLFEKSGWQVKKYLTNDLFYTGHLLFSDKMSVHLRRKLSSIAGSACHVFVLKTATPSDQQG
ncbi:MAG: class I SAM-dependent methyltransferase, partial [Pyrinomonadaceae bacterium]